jgi:hypothetical protein
MLLSIDPKAKTGERIRGVPLREFDLDERGFQEILFHLLDRLLPDDELLVICQSRRGPEEPDLMALDASARLYIFELKVWESKSHNLLQVFRYGQIFGSHTYDDLNRLFQMATKTDSSLADTHRKKFEKEIPKEDFNKDQVFVVMTNGIDTKTREAIKYWRSRKLEVQPWIYRVYKMDSSKRMIVEIAPFRVEDNPYEDSDGGYFILNTNFSNDAADHENMIKDEKAAAYSVPWKYKIEQIGKGDTVFLYKSGTGIVASGIGSGKVDKSPHYAEGGPEDQYSMHLDRFREISRPISAAEIKEITGNNYVFMGTMFGMDRDSGKKLSEALTNRLR